MRQSAPVSRHQAAPKRKTVLNQTMKRAALDLEIGLRAEQVQSKCAGALCRTAGGGGASGLHGLGEA